MDKPQSEKDTSKKSSEVTFEDLGVCKELCDAVRLLKWNTPTAIQQEAIPVALSGKDIIGLAQTGSGKTGAFAVPIIQALLDKGSHAFFALVLTPTRELAVQIQEQFNALGKGIGIKCAVIVGGMDMVTQTISLGKKPHVVIATPGRLVDHLENTKGFSLRSLKYLVMDEADRILNMDFETAMNKILKVIPRERHTYLYSATMTSKVAKLKRASLQDPVKVEPMETSAHKFSTVDTLTQHLLFIPAKHKEIYLVWVLNELKGNSFIIFCNTCMAVQRITLMLRHLGFQAVPIHGQMTQSKRLGALNKFKSQERSVLVASDVASRGLDIPHVDCVLNYDVPLNPKDYIHRVGRTARAGRAGKSVTFVSQYDIELYLRIEHLIGKKLPVFPYSKEEVMTFMDTVAEACRIAKLEQTDQNKKKKQRKRKHDDDEEDTEQSRGIRTKFKKRNMKEQKKK